MLSIPTACFPRSEADHHNIGLDAFCDWIEASVLFADYERLSSTDVVDALLDGGIYPSSDDAREMVENGWRELQRRQAWMGAGSSLELVDGRVQRRHPWQDNAAHSFLITLSIAKLYPAWARSFGKNYTVQGELFEELTKQALEFLFPGWGVYITGWARTRANKIATIVDEVAKRVCEPIGEIVPWTKPTANEAGLDVLCHYEFRDGKCNSPVYLFQCASGVGWEEKLHTPDLRIWTRIITFTCDPHRAFAIPFALTDREFLRISNRVNGMLFDRYRLLLPGAANPDWIDAELSASLVEWTADRIDKLSWDHE